jgi:hypothetical protein
MVAIRVVKRQSPKPIVEDQCRVTHGADRHDRAELAGGIPSPPGRGNVAPVIFEHVELNLISDDDTIAGADDPCRAPEQITLEYDLDCRTDRTRRPVGWNRDERRISTHSDLRPLLRGHVIRRRTADCEGEE